MKLGEGQHFGYLARVENGTDHRHVAAFRIRSCAHLGPLACGIESTARRPHPRKHTLHRRVDGGRHEVSGSHPYPLTTIQVDVDPSFGDERLMASSVSWEHRKCAALAIAGASNQIREHHALSHHERQELSDDAVDHRAISLNFLRQFQRFGLAVQHQPLAEHEERSEVLVHASRRPPLHHP